MAKNPATAKLKDVKYTYPYNCVLLIEDDEITNFINEDILKGLKLSKSITSTKSVEEAITFLEDCYLHDDKSSSILVFLDLVMSSKDGFDFLEDLSAHPDIPEKEIDIIILTNSLDEINREKAKKYTIMDYVAKPLSPEKIRMALGKKANSASLSFS